MKGTRDGDRRLERLLAKYAAPQAERVHSGIERVRGRLRSGVVDHLVNDATAVDLAPRRVRSRVLLLAAAAVLLLAAAGILSWAQLVSERGAPAVVEAGESSIYLVSDGLTQRLQPNAPIAFGEIVRSNGGAGGMLRLTDGSRVEVRSQSELTFERADDGVRIRLGRGGIIVNAAKQLAGHLYVHTKDVTVSVIGTVFLVNAEEQGSRVAVIEGEVRVQQGATEKKLTRGEQVATNPQMQVPPVIEEIAWSRNASAHQALLLQSSVAPTPLPTARNAADEPLAFEEASVRPSGVTVSGPGRGGLRRPPCNELFLDTARDGSLIFRVQLDPRRLSVVKTTLYTLIAWAHGKDCDALTLAGLFTGGPDWVRSDEWDIQALIPEGGATYTVRQFVDGHAPELQARLRSLLAKRFQLIVRTETREVPVYVLTLGDKPLKLRPRLENTGPGAFTAKKDELGTPYAVFMNVPESNFARTLRLATGRMVLDRTGLKDGFYLDLEFAPLAVTGISSRPSLFRALEEVGLRLEESKVPQDALVIERVEKPSEN